MKKKLFEYLNIVSDKNPTKEESAELYKKYIFKIGDFMAEYYGFSGVGSSKIIHFFIVFVVGVFLDFFAFLLFKITVFTLFTPMLLSIAAIRIFIKYRQRKVYGLFY